jgi:hypothetical protein
MSENTDVAYEVLPKVKKVSRKKATKVVEKEPEAPPAVVPKKTRKPRARLVIQEEEVEERVASPVAKAPKTPKAKRAPSAYNLWVKTHMAKDEIKALPPRERFAKISALYKASKEVAEVKN